MRRMLKVVMIGMLACWGAIGMSAPASAQNVEADNATLQKVLDGILPEFTDSALSATCVRTVYKPRAMDAPSDPSVGRQVERTVISEILAGSKYVKESIADSRLAKGSVKQYAFHYANDGRRVYDYDSRNQRGALRKSPKTDSSALGQILSPYAARTGRRFMSRGVPALPARLANARVTSEEACTTDAGPGIEIEGTYENGSPEARFKMTVAPERNYVIVAFTEYDAQGRALAEMRASDFKQVSGPEGVLWIRGQTVVTTYRRDDHEGNSIQTSKMEILDPSLVAARQDDFAFAFPADARRVHDATVDADLEKMRELLDKTFDDMTREADLALLGDKRGKSIIARTEEKRKTKTAEPLEMPKSQRGGIAIFAALIGLCAFAGIVAGLVKRKRPQTMTSMENNTDLKGDDVNEDPIASVPEAREETV